MLTFQVINQYPAYQFTDESLFQELVTRVSAVLGLSTPYLCSVVLITNEDIHHLNRQYRGKDAPTDVLSFPLMEKPLQAPSLDGDLGDIFISIDKVRQQAADYQHSERRELAFLFIHGLLHLMGYDHILEAEAQEMFRLQDEILDPIIPRYEKEVRSD